MRLIGFWNPPCTPEGMTSEQNLFEKLGRELFQTETSAMVHSVREAERLPGTPVAEA